MQIDQKTTPILRAKNLTRIPYIQHAFFTRKGGVSPPPYHSLNLSRSSLDQDYHIKRNIEIIMRYFNLPCTQFVQMHQIHSNQIITLCEKTRKQDFSEFFPKADALITNCSNIVLGVVTADCLPVLMADKKNKIIAAIHAGWKGAFHGILEASFNAMKRLGALEENIEIGIGPAIGSQSYEVDLNYREQFLNQNKSHHRFFSPSVEKGRFLFDLKGYAIHRLNAIGLSSIHLLEYDTYALPELFYSHRFACKHKQKRGLQLSAISLLPPA